MKRLAIYALAVCLAAAAHAQIVFNEILVNPAGSDDYREFIELRSSQASASATSLWILQIHGNVETNMGSVDEAWSLSGKTFGANGLLVIGNGYATTPVGGPWSSIVSPQSTFADPTGFAAGDLNNGTYSWLLVSNFSGSVGMDLDADDDGTLDSAPWSALLDGVAWEDGDSGDKVYAAFKINSMQGVPDAASRFATNMTPHLEDAWFAGDIISNSTDTLGRTYDYSAVTPNMQWKAQLTPGQLNYQAYATNCSVRINEIYINASDNDDDREFVEIIHTNASKATLNGLWLILVDSVDNTGNVLECWNLTGNATGTNGIALIGANYDTSPPGGPWYSKIPAATAGCEPYAGGSSGMSAADLRDNDNFTCLLTVNFYGNQGDDLDTDDDFHLDSTPWDGVVDSIGIGTSYAFAVVSPGFNPDVLARTAGNMATNSASAWYGGDISGADLTTKFESIKIFNLPLDGQMTPGEQNAPWGNIDSDSDALPDYWEYMYFGGRTAAVTNDDTDLDSIPNWFEYFSGSDPTDQGSVFQVTGVASSPTGLGLVVQWQAVSGTTYKVYSVNSLATGTPWTSLVFQATAKGQALAYTNPAVSSTNAFYLIKASR